MAESDGIWVIPAPESIAQMMRSQRPAVNVVCGPRHSGKTNFTLEQMGEGDFVWDYGEILGALFPAGADGNAGRIMSELKSAVFRHLLGATTFDVAWLVVQAPGKEERRTFVDRLNAKVFVIEATAGYCADASLYGESSQGAEVVRNEAIKWWSKYERIEGQEIIIPEANNE